MNPLSFCTIDMVDGDPKVLRYPLHTFKAAYMNLLYSEEEYDAKRDDYTTKPGLNIKKGEFILKFD